MPKQIIIKEGAYQPLSKLLDADPEMAAETLHCVIRHLIFNEDEAMSGAGLFTTSLVEMLIGGGFIEIIDSDQSSEAMDDE